ncbi:hypothetical protein EYF80_045853 [Liparis tanakae]|uniref:Uncharacterized protein n=1 Tax=Liparis tanakae TaxID=230148 RepID=A0A4Z2FS34_9TELE|nr:hypothetical protein EYF80_045853 [Liparis tanakae]
METSPELKTRCGVKTADRKAGGRRSVVFRIGPDDLRESGNADIQSSHRSRDGYMDRPLALHTHSHLGHFHRTLTWSASTKMILSTAKGNRTSRKRIL